MNFSQSSSIESGNNCKSFLFQTVPLGYSSAGSFYGLLVAAAVLNLAACPFTIVLNALVMVAVKIKRRLQTHPNILLACLALTDLMVGLVVQPLHVTKTIFRLQGKDFHEFCDIDLAFTISFVISTFASFFHLALISGERFVAIKHTFIHANAVTKVRLLISSTVAWIPTVILLLVATFSRVMGFACIAATFSSIVLLQILVYRKARRHEKQILSQQVSVEARAKFKKEMKALKMFLFATYYFICYMGSFQRKHFTKTLVRHFCLLPIINSVLNPVIYTVRKKEFRVAFIELLLRKSLQEAEEFERRLFVPTANNAERPRDEQEGEGQEQNAEQRNAAHADENQEDNPEVFASGFTDFDDNTTLATHNENVSSIALNSMSKKKEEEHGEKGNPAQAKNNLEDNPEDLVAGANFDDNITFALHEPFSSNALHIISKGTEEEHGEGRNPAHAKNNLEDNPEVIASGASIDLKRTETAQSENLSVL